MAGESDPPTDRRTGTPDPMPVTIQGPVPIPVVVEGGTVKATEPLQSQQRDPSLPAKTTFQEDLTHAGQRRINLIWEYTQALVTVLITGAAIVAAMKRIEADVLNFAFVAVISTYYARTNHTKVGGVGVKYEGR